MKILLIMLIYKWEIRNIRVTITLKKRKKEIDI